MEEVKAGGVATPSSESTSTTSESPQTAQSSSDSGSKSSKTDQIAAKIDQIASKNAASETQEYQPNFKFTVDKVDHEFDEWLRPVIKDADTEKKVRDLYEKAFGLEVAKPRHQKTQEKFAELENKHTTLTKTLDELSGYLNNEDLDSFFSSLKIPETMVLKWALNVVNRDKLPPDERQAYERGQQERKELALLRSQNQDLLQRNESSMVQARTVELDSVLARPEIKDAISAFDSRIGRPGAFRDEVIRRAIATFQVTGEDLSAERAVSDALQIFGTIPSNGGSQLQGNNQKPPVIPNVSGRAASPTRKLPTSIADLKKIRAEMSS